MKSNRIRLSVAALGWLLAFATPAGAHEKHTQRSEVELHHSASDSHTVSTRPASLPTRAFASDTAAAESPFQMPPIDVAMRRHLHNKLVHFPIVLAPMALLALLISRRRSDLARLSLTLAWLAALSAGMALWAGLAQAPDFEGEPKEWLVQLHRVVGIATTVALTLAALLGHRTRARRFAWIIALLAVLLVGAAGFLGGLVSHG